MELLFALLIVCLAACGLALGLILGGKPPQTACEGIACLKQVPCPGCPHRREARDG